MRPEAYAQMAAKEDRHWWYRARGRIIVSILRKFTPPGSARILDIGCGTGNDFVILSQFGEVMGVDYHPNAIAYCKQHGHTNIAQQDAVQLQFPDETFDLTCCLDVLNGIEDDAKAVAEAVRVTKKGGLLLFTVAANTGLWGISDYMSEHKRRYSRRTMLHLLSSQPCDILKFTSFNTIFCPFAYLERVLERHSLKRGEVQNSWIPAAPINDLLENIFSFERHLLARGSLPFGVSLMALVQKVE